MPGNVPDLIWNSNISFGLTSNAHLLHNAGEEGLPGHAFFRAVETRYEDKSMAAGRRFTAFIFPSSPADNHFKKHPFLTPMEQLAHPVILNTSYTAWFEMKVAHENNGTAVIGIEAGPVAGFDNGESKSADAALKGGLRVYVLMGTKDFDSGYATSVQYQLEYYKGAESSISSAPQSAIACGINFKISAKKSSQNPPASEKKRSSHPPDILPANAQSKETYIAPERPWIGGGFSYRYLPEAQAVSEQGVHMFWIGTGSGF